MKEMKKMTVALILMFLAVAAPNVLAEEAESTLWSSPFDWIGAFFGEVVSGFWGDDAPAPEGQNSPAGEEPEFHGYILPGG